MSQIERGKVDETVITDYILDEVLTFVRRRLGFEKSLKVLESILASDVLRIEKVDLREFQAAIIIFEKYRRLSFTDSATVAFMYSKDIEELYSFDKDFDGIPHIQRLT